MANLREKFKKELSMSGIFEAKEIIYYVLTFVGLLIMCVTVFLSQAIWETLFSTISPTVGFWLSWTLAISISITVGLTARVALIEVMKVKKKFYQSPTALFFIFCFMVNAGADYLGSPMVGESQVEKPSTRSTEAIEQRLAQIAAEQKQILMFYSWCQDHGKNQLEECHSTCKNVTIASTVSQIKGRKEDGYDQIGDKKKFQALDNERQTLLADKANLSAMGLKEWDSYQVRVNNSKRLMKGVAIALNLVFLAITWWGVELRIEADKIDEENTQGVAPTPQQNAQGAAPTPQQNAQGAAPTPQQNAQPDLAQQIAAAILAMQQGAPAPKKARPTPTPQELEEMQNVYASLAANHPALFEEIIAQAEAEKKANGGT